MNQQLPKLLKDFLIYISTIKGKSMRTRSEYQYDLVLLLTFLKATYESVAVENVTIEDIDIQFIREVSLEDFYAFMEYCKNERGNSAYARARKVAAIKAFFNYLQKKRRLIETNPVVELESPKIGTRQPIYLTVDEAKRFLSGIKKDRHYSRNKAMMTLLLNCGLRVSELCSINLSSIHNDMLTVIGKGDKERTIYLNQVSQTALKDYVDDHRSLIKNIKDDDALFLSQKGSRINKRTVQNLVKQINSGSGLQKAKLTPHKLRHTSATLLYQSGADIRSLQYILGHQNISTTQIYTHIDDHALREIIAKNPLNG